MSTHSIEMPFESRLFHFNQFEELEYEKQVEDVVHVHAICNLDNDPMCLDELSLDDDLDTHTPHVEQVESCCENECDNDELLFQAKFEDEFCKFVEIFFVEEPKISSIKLKE